MASWADRRDAYTMQRREQARTDQRRNALNEIFAGAYEAPQHAQAAASNSLLSVDDEGYPMPMERPAMPASLGGLNVRRAVEGMYTRGFAPEAMQLEQEMRAADLRRMQLGQKPSAVQVYEFYRGLPDDRSREEFLRTLRSPQYGDIGGVRSEMPVLPGAQARPLTDLSTEVAGQAAIAGGKAAAAEAGKQTSTAQAGLGAELDEISKMRTNVMGLIESPGFDTIYGLAGRVAPSNYVPGTDAANSQARREQLDAAAFGIAIQKMKGTGSLSDAEGKKVSAAFTRATNPKISAPEARAAWGEVVFYLDLAEKRAKEKAGKASVSPQDPIKPPPLGFRKGGYMYTGGDPSDPKSWKAEK